MIFRNIFGTILMLVLAILSGVAVAVVVKNEYLQLLWVLWEILFCSVFVYQIIKNKIN